MKLKQKGYSDKELEARLQIVPGAELYGFLGGLFGRDSYGVKTVVSVGLATITATENGVTMSSRYIDSVSYTWEGIVKNSNRALDEGDYEGAE